MCFRTMRSSAKATFTWLDSDRPILIGPVDKCLPAPFPSPFQRAFAPLGLPARCLGLGVTAAPPFSATSPIANPQAIQNKAPHKTRGPEAAAVTGIFVNLLTSVQTEPREPPSRPLRTPPPCRLAPPARHEGNRPARISPQVAQRSVPKARQYQARAPTWRAPPSVPRRHLGDTTTLLRNPCGKMMSPF
jgi:hypothetical protein